MILSRSRYRMTRILQHFTSTSCNQHPRYASSHPTSASTSTSTSPFPSPLHTTSPSPFTSSHDAEQSHIAWSSGASRYDEYFTRFFASYAISAIQHVAKRMSTSDKPLIHTSRILDVGTGTGALSLTAIQQGYQHVDAIDYAPDMIQKLEEKRIKLSIPSSQLRCQVMDGTNLTFPENHFDAVFAMFCVMFFPNQLAGLQSMHRVLRPGGQICVSAWAGMSKIDWIKRNNKAMLTVRPDLPRGEALVDNLSQPSKFSQLLQDAGFINVEVISVPQTFIIDDPKRFWQCMAESFPAIRHMLLTHFTIEQRQRVQEEFVKIVTKEANGLPVKLTGESLFALGTRA